MSIVYILRVGQIVCDRCESRMFHGCRQDAVLAGWLHIPACPVIPDNDICPNCMAIDHERAERIKKDVEAVFGVGNSHHESKNQNQTKALSK